MTIAHRIARRLASLVAAVGLALGATAAQAQTVIYYHTDALGSVVAVTDASRNVLERNEYEPYGKVINHALQDGPGYTGHVADAQTGLIYMQQRYYDDDLGEFPTVDAVTAYSTGGTFNRYWYANNNPYRFTDPDGRITREMRRQGFEDIGGGYVARVDKFNINGESRFEVHVYKDTKDLAKAIESGSISDVRALETNTIKQDGSWGKHGKPSEAPSLSDKTQQGLNQVVQRELSSRGMVTGGVDGKPRLREHLRANLGKYSRFLGPAGAVLEYTRTSVDRVCEMDPSNEGC